MPYRYHVLTGPFGIVGPLLASPLRDGVIVRKERPDYSESPDLAISTKSAEVRSISDEDKKRDCGHADEVVPPRIMCQLATSAFGPACRSRSK
jgi:hypothetical protein